MRLFGGGSGAYSAHFEEQPGDADVYSHAVAPGDVVVLATDGVWDNLSPEDVLRVVSAAMVRRRAWPSPEDGPVPVTPAFAGVTATAAADALPAASDLSAMLAAEIVREAKMASLNERRDGPFAKQARRLFPWEGYRGGKPDDICTVVAVVAGDGT
jgi:protein phosphatase PTC7